MPEWLTPAYYQDLLIMVESGHHREDSFLLFRRQTYPAGEQFLQLGRKLHHVAFSKELRQGYAKSPADGVQGINRGLGIPLIDVLDCRIGEPAFPGKPVFGPSSFFK